MQKKFIAAGAPCHTLFPTCDKAMFVYVTATGAGVGLGVGLGGGVELEHTPFIV